MEAISGILIANTGSSEATSIVPVGVRSTMNARYLEIASHVVGSGLLPFLHREDVKIKLLPAHRIDILSGWRRATWCPVRNRHVCIANTLRDVSVRSSRDAVHIFHCRDMRSSQLTATARTATVRMFFMLHDNTWENF